MPQQPLPNVAISEQGLREMELWLDKTLNWTPWVYFGTYPDDLNSTPRSPAFQSGWHNVGLGKQRLRFRRTVPHKGQKINSLEIEGQIAGGEVGTLVGTLPATFRPKETALLEGPTDAPDVAVFRLDTNGALTFLGTVGGGGGGSGGEVAFQDFTTPVSITATSEGSADPVVTAPSFTPNGTSAYLFEFYAPDANPDFATGTYLALYLFEDGSSIGTIWDLQIVSVGFSLTGVYAQARLTPTSSSHIYSIRAAVDTGTGVVSAGAGGSRMATTPRQSSGPTSTP